MNFETVICQLR